LDKINLNNYIRERFSTYYITKYKEEINANWSFIASTNTWSSDEDHNLNLNDVVMFTVKGNGAEAYSTNKAYYVVNVVSDTDIQISKSYKGDVLDSSEYTNGVTWKLSNINKARIYQNNAINLYNQKIKKENKELICKHMFKKGAVNIFNKNIMAEQDYNFYNYLETMKYKKTPVPGIYVHNFSLHPLEYQPSGSCNFSLTGDNLLKFEAADFVDKNNFGVLKIYGRSYNILRIMSGFGGLAFYE